MTSPNTNSEGLPVTSADAVLKNRQTVASYEQCARDYARSTAPQAGSDDRKDLRRFLEALEPGSHVLEVGSGPGWDADDLEAHGAVVRRTDVTASFIAFQQERGKSVERLDLIADELGGPHDGILARYVLQHIDRSLIDSILQRIADALRPGGVFLASLREGEGDVREVGDRSGVYHVTLWSRAAFKSQLEAVGLHTEWVDAFTDDDGHWMTWLASKNP